MTSKSLEQFAMRYRNQKHVPLNLNLTEQERDRLDELAEILDTSYVGVFRIGLDLIEDNLSGDSEH